MEGERFSCVSVRAFSTRGCDNTRVNHIYIIFTVHTTIRARRRVSSGGQKARGHDGLVPSPPIHEGRENSWVTVGCGLKQSIKLNLFKPTILSTYPPLIHTNNSIVGVEKERRILIGPWWPAKAGPVTGTMIPRGILAPCRRTLGSEPHRYAIAWPDKLGEWPDGVSRFK